MPWVFLDRQLLQCSGDGCTGVVQPSGVTALPQSGSLLYLVCSKLDPQPAACADVHGYEASHALVPADVSECLSCMETTAFRCRGRGGGLGGAAFPWLFALAACLVLAVGLVVHTARRSQWARSLLELRQVWRSPSARSSPSSAGWCLHGEEVGPAVE